MRILIRLLAVGLGVALLAGGPGGPAGAQEQEPPGPAAEANAPPRAVPVTPEPMPEVPPDAEAETVTFWEIIERGGVMMYPLAGLSFIGLSLIALYFLTVRQGSVVSERFMQHADSLIRKQDYLGLLAVCNRTNQCIARVTQKTLDFATKNPTASFDEVREITESEGTRQASLLNQRITYLADVGAIAPMIGLLGTVIGMIKSFNEIAQDSFIGAGQIQLAGGVSEALITTAAGLVIGIPALVFYAVFRGRVQRLIAELEAAATHVLALLSAQYKRAAARGGTPPGDGGRGGGARGRAEQYVLGQDKLDPQGL